MGCWGWAASRRTGENALGPSGGQLNFGGASLIVPAGALESEVFFSAAPVDLPPQAPLAFGPAFKFGPEGVVFKRPLELHLRVDDPTRDVQVITAPSVAGPWERLPTRRVDGLAVVSVSHFSIYYPSGPPDAGVDAGNDSVRDAGGDAGPAVLDAGVDAGVLDAGARCDPCTTVGYACEPAGGRCVFGYQALRILEPLDGSVVRVDGGLVTGVVELVPLPGLTPIPPPSLQSTVWFVISGTNPEFFPVADGGPYVATFPVTSASGAPYELSTYVTFHPPPPGDAGIHFLQDKVHFTTP